jgi:integrase
MFQKYFEIDKIEDCTLDIINKFKSIRKQEKKHLETINKDILFLRCLLKFAYKKKYIENHDWFEDITFYSVNKQTKEYIPTLTEINTLLANVSQPYKTAIMIARWTGMRRGEICHLEWSDIDFENNKIYIREKKNWKPKNYTSHRIVPIHHELKEYLIKIKKLISGHSPFIIVNESNNFERVSEDVLTSMITKYKKRLKISKEFCFHSLRHFLVTELAKNNINSSIISKIVGHSSSRITEQIYTHLKNDTFLEVIENLS